MHEVPTADKYYVYSSGEVQASIAAVLVDVDLKPAQPPTLEVDDILCNILYDRQTSVGT